VLEHESALELSGAPLVIPGPPALPGTDCTEGAEPLAGVPSATTPCQLLPVPCSSEPGESGRRTQRGSQLWGRAPQDAWRWSSCCREPWTPRRHFLRGQHRSSTAPFTPSPTAVASRATSPATAAAPSACGAATARYLGVYPRGPWPQRWLPGLPLIPRSGPDGEPLLLPQLPQPPQQRQAREQPVEHRKQRRQQQWCQQPPQLQGGLSSVVVVLLLLSASGAGAAGPPCESEAGGGGEESESLLLLPHPEPYPYPSSPASGHRCCSGSSPGWAPPGAWRWSWCCRTPGSCSFTFSGGRDVDAADAATWLDSWNRFPFPSPPDSPTPALADLLGP